MAKYYYIPFVPLADVSYLRLFSIYDLATFNSDTKLFDTIVYSSTNNFAKLLNVSKSTIDRIFSNTDYSYFFNRDADKKVIKIKNNFQQKERKEFIVITDKEAQYLRKYNDELFCKYYIYLKHYSRISKHSNNKLCFTYKQFLADIGYCSTSNSNYSKLTDYNKRLAADGILSYKYWKDNEGHTRIEYKFIGI